MSDTEAFLNGSSFGVAGASRDRSKYGNMVLRALVQSGRTPTVIHPRESSIEDISTFPSLSRAPAIESLAIITPPAVTRQLVDAAIDAGVQHIWMQPGAESQEAIEKAREAGISVVAGGPCLLVHLRFRDDEAVS